MISRPPVVASVLLLVAGAPFAVAQDPAADAFMKCAALPDEADRLACFDQAARNQSPPPPEVDAPEPAVESAPADAAPAPATPVSVDVVPAAAPAAIAITPSARQTGAAPAAGSVSATATSESPPPVAASETPAPEVGPAPPDENEFVGPPQEASGEFNAVVRRVAQQPRGEHVVYLENGMVWQENVKNSYFPVEVGDTVTFKKRRFGGYRLITDSGRAYEMKRLR